MEKCCIIPDAASKHVSDGHVQKWSVGGQPDSAATLQPKKHIAYTGSRAVKVGRQSIEERWHQLV